MRGVTKSIYNKFCRNLHVSPAAYIVDHFDFSFLYSYSKYVMSVSMR